MRLAAAATIESFDDLSRGDHVASRLSTKRFVCTRCVTARWTPGQVSGFTFLHAAQLPSNWQDMRESGAFKRSVDVFEELGVANVVGAKGYSASSETVDM